MSSILRRLLVPTEGFEPSKTQFLRLLAVPICISQVGKWSAWVDSNHQKLGF